MAGVASAHAANRRALLFIYYSTTKKTVSRLTKRVRGTHLRCCRAFGMRTHRASIFFSNSLRTSRSQFRNCKNRDEIRISCALMIAARNASARKNFQCLRLLRTPMQSDRVCLHSKKILHNLPRARERRGWNRSKTSESVTSDSRSAAVSSVKFLWRRAFRFHFARVLIARITPQVFSSEGHWPPADSLCRPKPSSLDRRTSRSPLDWS